MKPPHLLPRTPHAHAAWAKRHPHERPYVGRSVALSIGIHVLFAAMVVVLALWLDRVTFSKSRSVEQSGPAPEQGMTMNLVMPESHPPSPPPPKPTPEPGLPVLPFIQPFAKPPMMVTIIPPPPVPTPEPAPPALTEAKPPSPTPSPAKATAKPGNKPRPKYVAAHATGQGTGQGTAPDISSEQLAKLGYPAPNYPPQAQSLRETGTVLMEVGFGPDGSVTNAQVRQSSGFSLLDMSTRSFIRVHWKDIGRANTTINVPIIYTLK